MQIGRPLPAFAESAIITLLPSVFDGSVHCVVLSAADTGGHSLLRISGTSGRRDEQEIAEASLRSAAARYHELYGVFSNGEILSEVE
jgi:hypothetical protein